MRRCMAREIAMKCVKRYELARSHSRRRSSNGRAMARCEAPNAGRRVTRNPVASMLTSLGGSVSTMAWIVVRMDTRPQPRPENQDKLTFVGWQRQASENIMKRGFYGLQPPRRPLYDTVESLVL